MLLVIDVGNSNTVLGVYNGDILFKNWRVRTVENVTDDEYNMLFTSLFVNDKIKISEIDQTIISCVVPPINPILSSFCSNYLGHDPFWVDARSYNGMPILIDNKEELGADRIVNSVAAYKKYVKSLIVVDFGTATTFDVISERGEYLGGVISPGITISSEALFNRTSKIPRVDIFKIPKYAIGKNTVMSVQAGIIFGYAGLVDGVVKRLASELNTQPLVVSTGGLAPLMLKVSKTIEKVDPLLTLEGLRIIATDFLTSKGP